MKKLILICLLLLPIPVLATYINQQQMVQVTTDKGLTRIVVSANGRVQVVIQNQGDVEFEWDRSTDEVDGYCLYCKGPTEVKKISTEPRVTLTLPVGTYKCYVTANKGGIESGPSNNISVRITD